jgi:serine/threonine protein kinase
MGTAGVSMSTVGPGHVIGGKYQLASLLGRGSMGEVWLAHHLSLGEDVALKLLALESAAGVIEDPITASARFRFEARVAARLSRKTRHIVRVSDHGEQGEALAYLVMELLEGRTLEKRLLLSGEMPPAEVCQLVAQIARALECAHAEHVVHRDLKPANVFLARDEEGGLLVKVLDFGIARATRTLRISAPFSTAEGLVFGTPGYMSPEQAFGPAIDARADLWALATLAYEALTGALPLSGTSVQELQRSLLLRHFVPIHDRNPRLPANLARFFERAFASRVEDRFASASELASAFERALVVAGGTPEWTAPLAPVAVRRGDTLPMALDLSPRSTRPSSLRRAAWLLVVPAVSVPALCAAVAGRTLRAPTFVPASASAAASTTVAEATPLAPAPETASLVGTGPSPSVAPPASGSAEDPRAGRAPPGPAPGSLPLAGGPGGDESTSLQRVPASASAARPPATAAPTRQNLPTPQKQIQADKSATL